MLFFPFNQCILLRFDDFQEIHLDSIEHVPFDVKKAQELQHYIFDCTSDEDEEEESEYDRNPHAASHIQYMTMRRTLYKKIDFNNNFENASNIKSIKIQISLRLFMKVITIGMKANTKPFNINEIFQIINTQIFELLPDNDILLRTLLNDLITIKGYELLFKEFFRYAVSFEYSDPNKEVIKKMIKNDDLDGLRNIRNDMIQKIDHLSQQVEFSRCCFENMFINWENAFANFGDEICRKAEIVVFKQDIIVFTVLEFHAEPSMGILVPYESFINMMSCLDIYSNYSIELSDLTYEYVAYFEELFRTLEFKKLNMNLTRLIRQMDIHFSMKYFVYQNRCLIALINFLLDENVQLTLELSHSIISVHRGELEYMIAVAQSIQLHELLFFHLQNILFMAENMKMNLEHNIIMSIAHIYSNIYIESRRKLEEFHVLNLYEDESNFIYDTISIENDHLKMYQTDCSGSQPMKEEKTINLPKGSVVLNIVAENVEINCARKCCLNIKNNNILNIEIQRSHDEDSSLNEEIVKSDSEIKNKEELPNQTTHRNDAQIRSRESEKVSEKTKTNLDSGVCVDEESKTANQTQNGIISEQPEYSALMRTHPISLEIKNTVFYFEFYESIAITAIYAYSTFFLTKKETGFELIIKHCKVRFFNIFHPSITCIYLTGCILSSDYRIYDFKKRFEKYTQGKEKKVEIQDKTKPSIFLLECTLENFYFKGDFDVISISGSKHRMIVEASYCSFIIEDSNVDCCLKDNSNILSFISRLTGSLRHDRSKQNISARGILFRNIPSKNYVKQFDIADCDFLENAFAFSY